MSAAPLLRAEGLCKQYFSGVLRRRPTFRLEVDFTIEAPTVLGVIGPNGAGKTTLFEMLTGSNRPTAGRVLVAGHDIHRVKYRQRDRLAIHYHQSYQVRRFARRTPSFLLHAVPFDYPMVHLFDEPQFNTQDGYIGFMLDFFRKLRRDGRLVVICVHPTARYHLELLKEICERFLLVSGGGAIAHGSFQDLITDPRTRTYLGPQMSRVAAELA